MCVQCMPQHTKRPNRVASFSTPAFVAQQKTENNPLLMAGSTKTMVAENAFFQPSFTAKNLRKRNMTEERTMNTSKALDNDGMASKMSGLQSSMLTTAALSIVLIAHNNPWHPLRLETHTQKKRYCSHDYIPPSVTSVETVDMLRQGTQLQFLWFLLPTDIGHKYSFITKWQTSARNINLGVSSCMHQCHTQIYKKQTCITTP